MIIISGYKQVFKIDAGLGQKYCKNCGHTTHHSLCRQLNQATLFYIPILSITRQRGILCEYCGDIEPVDKADYKSLLQTYKQ